MKQSTKELLGLRIQEIRKIRKLTQEQLSRKVDLDAKHISRIEVGRSYPSLDTLEKLANALKVEISTFFKFSHHNAKNKRELKKTINELLADLSEDKLRLTEKVLKALFE
jgi:transcriptional regulator with XRE-family HTH domain